MKRLTFYTSFVSLLLFSNVAYSFDFNGTWSCRTGWWSYTTVKVKGHPDYEKGFFFKSIKIDNKEFLNYEQYNTYGVSFEIDRDGSSYTELSFWENKKYWEYQNEGVVVEFKTKTFSESEGTKWEIEHRYCERQ